MWVLRNLVSDHSEIVLVSVKDRYTVRVQNDLQAYGFDANRSPILTQTANTVSKQIEMRLHMTHVT